MCNPPGTLCAGLIRLLSLTLLDYGSSALASCMIWEMTLFSRFRSLLCYLVVMSQIDFVFFCLLATATCLAMARLLL